MKLALVIAPLVCAPGRDKYLFKDDWRLCASLERIPDVAWAPFASRLEIADVSCHRRLAPPNTRS